MLNIKKVAVVGTGVIGIGWIIRFLAHNKIVYAYDKNLKQKKILINEITPVGKEIKKLLGDKSHLLKILGKGREKANIIAEENLKNIREKVGLI